jgi:hypothetical protein
MSVTQSSDISAAMVLQKVKDGNNETSRSLEYRIVQAADGKPLIGIDSPLGNGQEIRPQSLRVLAKHLLAIADEADARDMRRGFFPVKSKVEF